ncbi:uncharacterized protein LOC143293539 [Babylonia areolata]|uniref:uncharacterized protein LOC143293539 n=1 Tax=Babylonia areolata TaxID=304850 RepID=UPI003FD4EDB0
MFAGGPFPKMPPPVKRRVMVPDLNPNLVCVLCSGYFIDATTLTECLHSFCKTCITKYLKTSKNCPVCDVMVHKTRPHLHIRSDKTLQDLVYKLIPGLYQNEMKRRRDFYAQYPDGAPSRVGEERGDENAERILFSKEDKFSVALHFCSRGVREERSVRTFTLSEVTASSQEPVRYLECPAGVTVHILKRYVRLRYDLAARFLVDIFHSDEVLRDDYTLIDVAYIYTWRRKEPLRLNFSVYEFIVKRRKLESTRLLNLNKLMKEENLAEDGREGSKDLEPTDLKLDLKQGDSKQVDSKKDPIQHSHTDQDQPGSRVDQPAAKCPTDQKTAQTAACRVKSPQKAGRTLCKRKRGEVGGDTDTGSTEGKVSPVVLIPVATSITSTTTATALPLPSTTTLHSTSSAKKGDSVPPQTMGEGQGNVASVSNKQGSQPCQNGPQELVSKQTGSSNGSLTSSAALLLPKGPVCVTKAKASKPSSSSSKPRNTSASSASKKKCSVSLLPAVISPGTSGSGSVLLVDGTSGPLGIPGFSVGASVKMTGCLATALPQQQGVSTTTAQTFAAMSQQASKTQTSQQTSRAQTSSRQTSKTQTSQQTPRTHRLLAPKTLKPLQVTSALMSPHTAQTVRTPPASKTHVTLHVAGIHTAVQSSNPPMSPAVPKVLMSSQGPTAVSLTPASTNLTLWAASPGQSALAEGQAGVSVQSHGGRMKETTTAKSFVSATTRSAATLSGSSGNPPNPTSALPKPTSAPSSSASALSTQATSKSNSVMSTPKVKPGSTSTTQSDCSENVSQRTTGQQTIASTKPASPASRTSSPSTPVAAAGIRVLPQPVTKAAESPSGSRAVSRPAVPKAVSVPVSLPSAAAAAAGAASPSPAALAASSSPSPPMASSAASVRDEVEATHKCVAPATVCSVPPTVSAPSASLKVQPSCSARQKGAAVSGTCAVKALLPVGTAATSGGNTPTSSGSQSSRHTHVRRSELMNTGTSQRRSPTRCTSQDRSSTSAKQASLGSSTACSERQPDGTNSPAEQNPEAGSITTGTALTPETLKAGEALTCGKHEDTQVKGLPQTNPSADTDSRVLNTAQPSTDTVGAPPAGVQTKAQTPGQTPDSVKTADPTSGAGHKGVTVTHTPPATTLTKGPLTSRNGMPTVVTRPTRVINASTSVNTLCHKLPATSTAVSTPSHRLPVTVSDASQRLPASCATTTSSGTTPSQRPQVSCASVTTTTSTPSSSPAPCTSVSTPSHPQTVCSAVVYSSGSSLAVSASVGKPAAPVHTTPAVSSSHAVSASGSTPSNTCTPVVTAPAVTSPSVSGGVSKPTVTCCPVSTLISLPSLPQ